MGERIKKSKWALAYILQTWRNRVGPLARKAYKADATDAEVCAEIALLLGSLHKSALEAEKLAKLENNDGR